MIKSSLGILQLTTISLTQSWQKHIPSSFFLGNKVQVSLILWTVINATLNHVQIIFTYSHKHTVCWIRWGLCFKHPLSNSGFCLFDCSTASPPEMSSSSSSNLSQIRLISCLSSWTGRTPHADFHKNVSSCLPCVFTCDTERHTVIIWHEREEHGNV